ncbi:MAG: hypothetical protein ACYSUN_11075 [Planctomycetota bacterium]|jgi:hypothetical protein
MPNKVDKSETEYLIVSYVPLLSPKQDEIGRTVDLSKNQDGINNLVNSVCDADGHVAGVMWFDTDGRPSPAFAIADAKKVVEHLTLWSEGDPSEWFDLRFVEHNGKYALSLFPRVGKSIERFRLAIELMSGSPIDKNSKFTLLFQPWVFISQETDSFSRVREKFLKQETVNLGFIDVLDINPKWGSVDGSSVIPVGEFNLESDDNDYLKNHMEK